MKFEKRQCPLGDNCHYAHGQAGSAGLEHVLTAHLHTVLFFTLQN